MTKKKETKRIENNFEYFSTPIWSTSLPEWVDENILHNYFKKYNTDPIIYQDKKTNKRFQYL